MNMISKVLSKYLFINLVLIIKLFFKYLYMSYNILYIISIIISMRKMDPVINNSSKCYYY